MTRYCFPRVEKLKITILMTKRSSKHIVVNAKRLTPLFPMYYGSEWKTLVETYRSTSRKTKFLRPLKRAMKYILVSLGSFIKYIVKVTVLRQNYEYLTRAGISRIKSWRR